MAGRLRRMEDEQAKCDDRDRDRADAYRAFMDQLPGTFIRGTAVYDDEDVFRHAYSYRGASGDPMHDTDTLRRESEDRQDAGGYMDRLFCVAGWLSGVRVHAAGTACILYRDPSDHDRNAHVPDGGTGTVQYHDEPAAASA